MSKMNTKNCNLPTKYQPWPRPQRDSSAIPVDQDDAPADDIRRYLANRQLRWGGRTVYFFCDLHADADAFLASLVASGGINITGPEDDDFDLTRSGQSALFILGGDCFDKGPNTLRLLDVIASLMAKQAEVLLLAGNHDIRTLLGVFYADSKTPLTDHLFVHMGTKVIPLLKQIYDQYVDLVDAPSAGIKQQLMPDSNWAEEFTVAARPWLKQTRVEKEIRRIVEKSSQLTEKINQTGMNFSQILAAINKFKELFLTPGGLYYWFFEKIQLLHQEGSYLFVHAGIDDRLAQHLANEGVSAVNAHFQDVMSKQPFELYLGPLGNALRTKYSKYDFDFSQQGGEHLHAAGIDAIVHGHHSNLHGQRLLIRQNLLNFACDASIDCNTRRRVGLQGPGAAVVVFESNGMVKGISTDYDYIKVFKPDPA
ncbi:MAG: metallophosphoesterase [Pseudomonadales bacterium]|nr:metallophosphoesterase [Pseudomonadales bacterium]